MSLSEGWAVEIEGHGFDLDEVRSALSPPFDPWIETDQNGPSLLLRSNSWSLLQEASDVTEDARRILDRINGALLLNDTSAQPLMLAGIRKLDKAGNRLPIIFAATAHIKISGGRIRAVGQVLNANGVIVEPPPPDWRGWLNGAEKNDALADLLVHLTRLDNWYDVYKCMELVERLSDGPHNLLVELLDDGPLWKRTRQTANTKRHAPSPAYPLPSSPPTLLEARALVLRVARQQLAAHW